MGEIENWNTYFESTKANPPSDSAMNAMNQFGSYKGNIIDLGCGAGTDSLYFLEHGWNVIAIDAQPDFIMKIREEMPKAIQDRFEIRKMLFEELTLPNSVDCIIANFSLPFCNPKYYMKMWNEIVNSIKVEGIFSGVFFGDRDEWAQEFNGERTFLSKDKVLSLFEQFQIIDFLEEENDGKCCGRNGKPFPKHWHIFKVVARKNANANFKKL